MDVQKGEKFRTTYYEDLIKRYLRQNYHDKVMVPIKSETGENRWFGGMN